MSSSFQQNWIHSIRSFHAKVIQFLVFCCFPVAGTTGLFCGTTAGLFRSNFRRPLPLMNFRFCYRAEVAPELVPVLPLYRKYRPLKRYYRWSLPRLLPDTTFAYENLVLLPSGTGTGSNPGSTGKPVLPVVVAEVPPRRVSQLAVGRLFLGGPEVPPFGPVLPVPRVFVSSRLVSFLCIGR